MGTPSVEPTGWTALQSYGGLTGASENSLSEVKLMDQAFNSLHGVGSQLRDETMTDPIKTTAEAIQKRCPGITEDAIKLFTKIKYHARVKALNEQNFVNKISERKRKAIENKEKPKKIKLMRDFVKDGHFLS